MADAEPNPVPEALRAAVERSTVVDAAEFDLLESGWSEAGVAGFVDAAVLHVAVGTPVPEPGLLAAAVGDAGLGVDIVGDLAPDLVAVLVDADAAAASRLADDLRSVVEESLVARPVWIGVALGQSDDGPGAIRDRAVLALGQARRTSAGEVVVVGRT